MLHRVAEIKQQTRREDRQHHVLEPFSDIQPKPRGLAGLIPPKEARHHGKHGHAHEDEERVEALQRVVERDPHAIT